MVKKTKDYAPDFKFNLVLESYIKGNVSEVARQYEIHPGRLSVWRKEFILYGHMVFEKNPSKIEKDFNMKIKDFENLIRKKDLEISVLKHYLDSCFYRDSR